MFSRNVLPPTFRVKEYIKQVVIKKQATSCLQSVSWWILDLHFDPEDGGSTSLQNIHQPLAIYKMLHPRRQYSSQLQPWNLKSNKFYLLHIPEKLAANKGSLYGHDMYNILSICMKLQVGHFSSF